MNHTCAFGTWLDGVRCDFFGLFWCLGFAVFAFLDTLSESFSSWCSIGDFFILFCCVVNLTPSSCANVFLRGKTMGEYSTRSSVLLTFSPGRFGKSRTQYSTQVTSGTEITCTHTHTHTCTVNEWGTVIKVRMISVRHDWASLSYLRCRCGVHSRRFVWKRNFTL